MPFVLKQQVPQCQQSLTNRFLHLPVLMTVEKVSQILQSMPNEKCELDPIPTQLINDLCDVFVPMSAGPITDITH